MKISYFYYGTHQKWRKILEANPELNPRKINPGQTIIIPDLQKRNKTTKNIIINSEYDKRKEEDKEKLRHSNESKQKKQATKITEHKKSKPLKTSYDKDLKQRLRNLEKKVIKLKQENFWYREQLHSLKEKEEEFANWEREKLELRNEVKELEGQISQTEGENQKLVESNSISVPAEISYTQSQILKEKSRILANKLWIEKNKDVNKCVLHLDSNFKETKTHLSNFINDVNALLGEHHVFSDTTSNEIRIRVPGEVVYSMNPARINKKYQALLSQISSKMFELPIEKIHIQGHSSYKNISLESGEKVSGEFFTLSQSQSIRRYFVQNEGWSPRLFSVGTFGHSLQTPAENQKFFDIKIQLKRAKPKREIASELSHNKILNNISNDILMALGEPKYSSVNISNDELHIHLGRHYILPELSGEISIEGKKKIDSIMNMLSMVPDATYQIQWVPGFLEKQSTASPKTAFKKLDSIRKYIFKKHQWSKGQVEFGYSNRLNRKKITVFENEDKYNSRLVFKVIPNSIHTRVLREPSSVNSKVSVGEEDNSNSKKDSYNIYPRK